MGVKSVHSYLLFSVDFILPVTLLSLGLWIKRGLMLLNIGILTEITVDLDILVASWFQEIIPDTTRFFTRFHLIQADRGIAAH